MLWLLATGGFGSSYISASLWLPRILKKFCHNTFWYLTPFHAKTTTGPQSQNWIYIMILLLNSHTHTCTHTQKYPVSSKTSLSWNRFIYLFHKLLSSVFKQAAGSCGSPQVEGQDWNCKISPHSVRDQLFLFAQISVTVKIGSAKIAPHRVKENYFFFNKFLSRSAFGMQNLTTQCKKDQLFFFLHRFLSWSRLELQNLTTQCKKDQLFLFAQISVMVKIGTAKSHHTV